MLIAQEDLKMLLRNQQRGASSSSSKQLAFDKVRDQQGVITPQIGNAIGFLKCCRNVRTYKHGAKLAAFETYALQNKATELHQSLREQLENGHTELFFNSAQVLAPVRQAFPRVYKNMLSATSKEEKLQPMT